MPDEAEPLDHNPSHWARHSTDALRELLESLEALEHEPQLAVAGVKAELERRHAKE